MHFAALSISALLTLTAPIYAAVLPRAASISGRFNLAAFNPATNTTTPLYLHVTGARPRQSWSVLVTGADTAFTGFSLDGGALSAYSSNSYLAPTAAIGNTLGDPNKAGQTGPWPTFATNGAVPVYVFSAVPSAVGPTSSLAMNGRTNAFSLCRSYITSSANGVFALVYEANPAQLPNQWSYDGASCSVVEVVIVPQA